jgi:hypothetical protein
VRPKQVSNSLAIRPNLLSGNKPQAGIIHGTAMDPDSFRWACPTSFIGSRRLSCSPDHEALLS